MAEQPSTWSSRESGPRATLYGLLRGFWISRVLWVAAKLALADLLSDGARDSAYLARATGTHVATLHRGLKALCSVGVFREDDSGRFMLTPVGTLLRSDRADSLRASITMALGGEHYEAWGDLMHTVCTGQPAFEHRFGEGIWTYQAHHAELAQVFDDAMANYAAPLADGLLASDAFTGLASIVDVGGGRGALVEAILRANPWIRAVVLDLPYVAAKARERMRASGLISRCEVIEGDMFRAVPGGGDAYILSHVIHGCADDEAVTVLRNCRRAMPAASRVLVIERLLPERVERGAAAQAAVFSDLVMMVMNGGRERTEDDYRALFSVAGLKHTRTITIRSDVSLIEAAPD